ncbi:MAG: hypothetical protein J2P57_04925 [Acidimicrobiaceae bacterium]|nr:hypothetical protein [Acidimicrobiaceae bacterium]
MSDTPDERRAGAAGYEPRSRRALVVLPLFDAEVILALCDHDLAGRHEAYPAVTYLREAIEVARRVEERSR